MAGLKELVPATLLVAMMSLLGSGCGNKSPRVLQSISVTPGNADAQSFPNGQVQFMSSII